MAVRARSNNERLVTGWLGGRCRAGAARLPYLVGRESEIDVDREICLGRQGIRVRTSRISGDHGEPGGADRKRIARDRDRTGHPAACYS